MARCASALEVHSKLFFMIAAIAFLVLTIMSSSSSTLVDAQITYTDAHRRGAVRESNIIKCMHGQTTENYYLYSKCIEVFSTNHSVFMATNNYWGHSKRSYSDRTCYSNRGYGENIAAGRATAVANFGGWYWDELPNLNPAQPDDSSKGVVGHLTAVVWKAATRFGMGGGWSSTSTYKYYWTHNPSSPTASLAPNMSGQYLANVGPVSTTMNYTKCERDVFNYYNTNPTTYFDTTEAAYSADGAVIISNVQIDGASTAGTVLTKNTTVTVTWTASSVGSSTFQVIFYDTGSDLMDSRGKVASTIKSTLATGLASATRTATVTIPAAAQSTDYGLMCVVSGEERACVGGLSIRKAGGHSSATHVSVGIVVVLSLLIALLA